MTAVEPHIVSPTNFSRHDAHRRWADLLRRIYEVDPFTCPSCGGQMRIVAFIQSPKVIDRIPALHCAGKRPNPAAAVAPKLPVLPVTGT